MNILLSDRFAEGFGQLGNVANRVALDAGKVSTNQLFWEGVQDAKVKTKHMTTDNMDFADDEVFQ